MRAHPDLSVYVQTARPLLPADAPAGRLLPVDPRIALRQRWFGPMVEAEDAMKRLALSWPPLQRQFEARRPGLLACPYDFVLRDGSFEVISGALGEADGRWLSDQLNQQAGLRYAASQFSRAAARYYSHGSSDGHRTIAASILDGGIPFLALLGALQEQARQDRDRLRGSAAVNKLTTGRPYLYAVRLVRYGLAGKPTPT